MNTRDQEVEELANQISLETDDVPLSRTSGIEKAFYIQMATNLISKGYRKTDPSCPCEKLVPLDYKSIRENIRFHVEHLVAKVTDDRDYISKRNRTEGHIDAIASLLCDKFGTKPIVVPSVGDIANVMGYENVSVTSIEYAHNRGIWQQAEAIHAMLSKEVK